MMCQGPAQRRCPPFWGAQCPRLLMRIHCCHEGSWWLGLFYESFQVKLDLGRCWCPAPRKLEDGSPVVPWGPLSPSARRRAVFGGFGGELGHEGRTPARGNFGESKGLFGKLIIAQSSRSHWLWKPWRITSLLVANDASFGC